MKPPEEKRTDASHDTTGGLRWLLTYADMITLLLAFFVILYAISATSTHRFKEFASAVKQGFSIFPADYYKTEHSKAPVLRNKNPMETLDNDLAAALSQEVTTGNVKVAQGPEGTTISIADSALFQSGQADIMPAAREMLDRLAAHLASLSNDIVVEGHTDNVPVNSARFPSNWELSSGRAVNVVKYLAQSGVSPGHLSAAGYGEFRPRVPSRPAGGTPENRRIDIVVKNAAPSPVIQSASKPSLTGADFEPFIAPGR